VVKNIFINTATYFNIARQHKLRVNNNYNIIDGFHMFHMNY